MFADDTNITTFSKSITKLVQFVNTDLDNLNDWLLANKLSLNVTKTEQMYIASDNSLNKISDLATIHLANKQIRRVKKSKSLGITIDERLSWTDHIDIVSKKVSSAIGGLRQVRSFINKETAITIYNSLIQPLFDYCDIVQWDSLGASQAKRLQKLNNRAGRAICQLGYEVRSSLIRSQLGWSTLEDRRRKKKSITMHKILYGNAAVYLKQCFHYANSRREYNLRRSENIILPKPKTEYLRKVSHFLVLKYGIVFQSI